MKKNIFIPTSNHQVHLITNGAENFDSIVLCFHGFNGDKWGGAYAGLKNRLTNSLVASFDSCGHGESEVDSQDMRLGVILEEVDAVVKIFQSKEPDKPLVFVANSYGSYRVMQYLIKYKPDLQKVIYVNPAFRMLKILETIRGFNYLNLKDGDKVVMKESLNKFISKEFLDDLYKNDLYTYTDKINYDTQIVVGKRDSLIPVQDTIEIAKKHNYDITYIDEEHSFENKDNWQVVADIIEGRSHVEEHNNWWNG